MTKYEYNWIADIHESLADIDIKTYYHPLAMLLKDLSNDFFLKYKDVPLIYTDEYLNDGGEHNVEELKCYVTMYRISLSTCFFETSAGSFYLKYFQDGVIEILDSTQ